MSRGCWAYPMSGAETRGDVNPKLFHENPKARDHHSAITEGLQNSSDGTQEGKKTKIRVTVDVLTGDAKKEFRSLPFFDAEFMKRLSVVAESKSRTDRSVQLALNDFEDADRPLTNIIVEDFNTHGLGGKEDANLFMLLKDRGTRYDWARAVWNVGSSAKDYNKSGSKGLGILTFAVKSGLRMVIYYTVVADEKNPDLRHRFVVRWASESYCYPLSEDGKNYGSSCWGVPAEDPEKKAGGFVYALTGDRARDMAKRLNISRGDDENGTTLICVSYLEDKEEGLVEDIATQVSKKFWVTISDGKMSCEIRRRENGRQVESVDVVPSMFGQGERVDLLRRYRDRVAKGEDASLPGECMEAALGAIPKRIVDPKAEGVKCAASMVFVKKTEEGGKDDMNTIHVVRRGMTVDYYDNISSRFGFVGFVLVEGDDDESKALSMAISSMENNLHNMLTVENARKDYERGLAAFLSSFHVGIKNAVMCLLRNGDSEDIDETDTPFDKYGWGEGGAVIPADYAIEVVDNRLEMDGNDVVVPFKIVVNCDNRAGASLHVSASGLGQGGRTAAKIPTRRPEVSEGGRVQNGLIMVRAGATEVFGSVRINRHDCLIEPRLMSIALTVDKEG